MKLWLMENDTVRMVPSYFVLISSLLSLLVSVSSSATNPTKAYDTKPPTSEDFLVHGLEEIEPAFASFQGRMYAGLLPTSDYSSSLPPIHNKDGTNASGENDDDGEDGALYFWLFEPSNEESPSSSKSSSPSSSPSSDSLLIWLNGGPGCSSFNGLFFECSPVTVPLAKAGHGIADESAPFVSNPYSWTNAPTNIMFVEQPMGTGFSYGPEPHDETDISESFYNFLQHFYHAFPTYQKYDLFIFGESYAGMYVPSIAHYIYQQNLNTNMHNNNNDDNSNHDVNIKLEGIGLGNGVVDAKIQGPVVIDYAYWHGMIDIPTKNALYKIWDDCMEQNIGQYTSTTRTPYLHPFNTPDECGILEAVQAASGAGATLIDTATSTSTTLLGPNIYDVTTWDIYRAPFTENGTITKFFNDPRVRSIMHAPAYTGTGLKEWMVCIPGAGRRRTRTRRRLETQDDRYLKLLDQDRPLSMLPYISDLLDKAGIRVLFYNGDRDLSCCLQGTERLLNELEWYGSTQWKSPSMQRSLWMVEHPADKVNNLERKKQMAGYVKEYGQLQFLMIYNSGHMVPTNQPLHSLDLIRRFIRNESYADVPLPNFQEFVLERQGQEPQQQQAPSTMNTTPATKNMTQQQIDNNNNNTTTITNKTNHNNDHLLKHILLVVAGSAYGFICALLLFVHMEKKKGQRRLGDAESVTEMEYQPSGSTNYDDGSVTGNSSNEIVNDNGQHINMVYSRDNNVQSNQEKTSFLTDIGYGSTLS